jgi:hypothetical protein
MYFNGLDKLLLSCYIGQATIELIQTKMEIPMRLTVVLPYSPQDYFERALREFSGSPLVQKIIVVNNGGYAASHSKCESVPASSLTAGALINQITEKLDTDYLLFVNQAQEIALGQAALERFTDIAQQTGAGLAYSDFYEVKNGVRAEHPLIDYQLGSIRDNFDFGALMFFSTAAIREAVKKYGPCPEVQWAGLYDLRLKTSIDHPVFHIQEFLYTKTEADVRKSGEKQFDYVDPRNQAVQKEMEEAATQHLKNIGAYLAPRFKPLPPAARRFPVEASVIIPVRNRAKTAADAVQSALKQKADFPFNVIAVDNHSTDGTADVLAKIAQPDKRVKHIIPARHDLGIGGCWNEALLSEHCGKFAAQLDSDDIYSDEHTLEKVVNEFNRGEFAMVIGSYRLVNFDLQEIPPGVIDHREWTPENGRNNALRINGLGAPRAFRTELVRQALLPNVSYGEDYAIALRLSREYQIGRIYEPIYLCRRWEGNTDAALPLEKINRHDLYKDRLRTIEIMARQRMNREGK